MHAIDTNIIVRLLVDDHAEQTKLVKELLSAEKVWVPITVLLETCWVLRHTYKFGTTAILGALRHFARLPNVSLENDSAAIQAFDLMEKGMDDADAFHLAASIGCKAMISFDVAFRKIAKREGALEVRVPN
ncbi:hypothetical protein BLM14_29760 (plasmid) [Phyllobacterium zundukense]|uniref:type II toxin-antitoxin system VapC family toxin n=1 Tax=Phyllobacterium zundukense TaxID=1867719 RepID=UPI000C1C4871|nr:type II toxin-antitoxin system VapC family toxin [Phyllobacterium zundukense]ATU95912.1 hypothetical protein BLM14_29760 [Phyllobacterium zundukense]